MGVNIFILDRRPVKLAVAGVVQDVGSLRGFWKITELDEERAAELTAWEAAVSAMPSPKAALIADVVGMPIASKPDIEISAHQVIGWERSGRNSSWPPDLCRQVFPNDRGGWPNSDRSISGISA